MGHSNGNSFNGSSGYSDRTGIPGRDTEPWWVRMLGPIQPGAA